MYQFTGFGRSAAGGGGGEDGGYDANGTKVKVISWAVKWKNIYKTQYANTPHEHALPRFHVCV